MVVRCGYGLESKAIKRVSHSEYSHIGILYYDGEAKSWNVIHAVPQETAPEYLKCEAIDKFFSLQRASHGAWLRVDCDDSIAHRAARYALQKVERKTEFDHDYLLEDTTRMYCTELVWRAYLQQGIDISDGKRHDVTRFVSKEGECIFPYDIIDSHYILFINQFNIKHL